MKIGMQALRIAIAGFVVPFMAVYAPALMLQGGTWFDTGYVVFKAIVAIILWGGAAIGFWLGPLRWFERAMGLGGGGLPGRCIASHGRDRARHGGGAGGVACDAASSRPCRDGLSMVGLAALCLAAGALARRHSCPPLHLAVAAFHRKNRMG